MNNITYNITQEAFKTGITIQDMISPLDCPTVVKIATINQIYYILGFAILFNILFAMYHLRKISKTEVLQHSLKYYITHQLILHAILSITLFSLILTNL